MRYTKQQRSQSQELNKLVQLYACGDMTQAKLSAKKITRLYPDCAIAWKVLGAVLHAEGSYKEAVIAKTKAVNLSKGDCESHSNLSTSFLKLGEVVRAKESALKAINLNPNFPPGFLNLAIALREMGDLVAARESCIKSLAILPEFPEAKDCLGLILKDMGCLRDSWDLYKDLVALFPNRHEILCHAAVVALEIGELDVAESLLSQSLDNNPKSSEAYFNLGVLNEKRKRPRDAMSSWVHAVELDPSFDEAKACLALCYSRLGNMESAEYIFSALQADQALDGVIALNYGHHLLATNGSIEAEKMYLIATKSRVGKIAFKANVYIGILNYIRCCFDGAAAALEAASGVLNSAISTDVRNEVVYKAYLTALMQKSLKNPRKNAAVEYKTLHVFGESHALSAHNLRLTIEDDVFWSVSEWFPGCKMWHFAQAEYNHYKHKLANYFYGLPNNSYVLLTVGEIDCRIDEGIMCAYKKDVAQSLHSIVSKTVDGYINYVANLNLIKGHKITIQGVPAPMLGSKLESDDEKLLITIIDSVNRYLKDKASSLGFHFLDVYSMTKSSAGVSDGDWHIDNTHLKPAAIVSAFDYFLIT